MNNKLLTAITACGILASSCNHTEKGPLELQHEKITHEIGKVLQTNQKETNSYDTINFDELIESDTNNPCKYAELIQNIQEPIIRWDMTKPEFSLTFDDWYWSENINKILDILQENNIHSTFFVLWECLKQNPELWKQAIEQWHQICNHTYSHHYLKNQDTTLLKEEIIQREETVKDILWEEYLNTMKSNFPFFRFPWWYWSSDTNPLNILKELWYLPIARSDDNRQFWDKIRNWEIILMHFKEKDIERLESCILEAWEQNMKPKQITEIVDPQKTPIWWKNIQEEKSKAMQTRLEQFEKWEITEDDLLDHTP